ncbi:MAG: hypothetical protein HY735_27450 [Verrucomicrobia bacterium]|nr:hypothetical protein [Verrucomicrobiota bacterium]
MAIPLVANRTNVVVVAGTATSWTPAFGGNTTFNDTLTVACSPIRATLVLQGSDEILNWTGGGPPYTVQGIADLATGGWTEFLTNAVPPLIFLRQRTAEFYRVVGH